MADVRLVLPPRAAAAVLTLVRSELEKARRRSSRLFERTGVDPDPARRKEAAGELTEVNEWAADLWSASMALEKGLLASGEKKSDFPLFPLD